LSVTFDPGNRYILINAPVVEISAQTLYNESMDWCDELPHSGYSVPMSATGKALLGQDIYTDSIFVLENNWKIKFWSKTSHTFIAIPDNSTKITAESTDAGDTTQKIEIHGYNGNGEVVESDEITLNGTSPVDITKDAATIDFTAKGFCSGIYYVHLDGTTTGNVIVKASTGSTIVTLTAGETEARDNYQATITGTIITSDASPRTVPPDTGYVEVIFSVSSYATIIDQTLLESMMTEIHSINVGRWKIDTGTNTLTYYDTDGITPLVTFNLKDKDGLPAYQSVMERVPT